MYSNAKIQALYDNNPNMTLAQLASITGLSIDKLKAILLAPPPNPYARHRSYY